MVHCLRRARRREDVLGQRHGLDDGAVGAARHDAARRNDRDLRRRARLPGPDRLWALVERHRVNILGVSPTLIRSLMRHGEEPVRAHALSSLRILGSTGEPWNPEPWRWLFDVVGGSRLPIINYSGGTEVSGRPGGRQRAHAAEAGGVRRTAAGHCRRRRRRRRDVRCGTRSASWSCGRRGSA